MLAAVFLAFGLGAAVSIAYTLYLGYTSGPFNFNNYPFTRYSWSGFARALSQMKSPDVKNELRLGLFGIGAVVMTALIVLKYRV